MTRRINKIIEVLDSQSKVTGYELDVTYIDDNGIFDPKTRLEQASADDVAALRKTSADAHVVETTALNAQIADMQATISAKDDTIREKDAEITRITAEKDAAVEVAGSALVETVKQ